MKEFTISMKSVQDVQSFVALSTSRPFPVMVRNGQHLVSANSFMELCCLDFSRPLTVSAECSEEEFTQFCQDAQRFLVK